jgi:predicted TPR repeat methyltransferase
MATLKLKNTPPSNFTVSHIPTFAHLDDSTRNQEIQSNMTYRALELLNLPEDTSAMLLDIGCGSGLSGEILDEEGHVWIGVDIAPSMLGNVQLFLSSILSLANVRSLRGCT